MVARIVPPGQHAPPACRPPASSNRVGIHDSGVLQPYKAVGLGQPPKKPFRRSRSTWPTGLPAAPPTMSADIWPSNAVMLLKRRNPMPAESPRPRMGLLRTLQGIPV